MAQAACPTFTVRTVSSHIITIIVVVGTSTWRMHVALGRISEERRSIPV